TITNLQSCTSSTTNKTIYNRINSLKVALLTLLTNNTVNNDIGLGIGVFSYNDDGKTGIIRYPIQKLTMENRQLMANYVAGLTAKGGTPTPSAFAEAGAYMLGTNTSGTGSGFTNSDNITKIPNRTRYLQGAQQTTCAGNGIYLLTDGEPNTSVKAADAKALMNTSLSTTATKVTNCELLPDGTRGALGWGCMAEYGQILASNSNATGLPIKTATVGFGSDMAGLSTPTTINGKKVYNCTSSTDKDVQNLCRLGQEFGGGGYYYADSSQDVIDSLAAFMDVLGADIRPVPSGTIVVPDDPYRADSQLAVAYYPILQAEVGKSTAVWSGNLKKYNLNEGTLYGKSDAALFSDIAGKLNPSTEDLWSAVSITKDGAVANDLVTSGGFFSNLKTPDTAVNNIRTLYIEDKQSATNNTPVIRKFGVTDAGKLTLTNLSGTSGDAISAT
ncbi:pilus assembly protein PilY, partial [Salmonella enterica subsp. enterica]|nr:pilus assembly protein PilY [Salmonella enterica subsp. enterica serovar Bovismorbificans]